MTRPLLFDCFCKAGGTSKGYSDAGFDVVGCDIEPQPNYPFPFVLGDAMDILRRLINGEGIELSDGRVIYLSDIAVIAGSPPCQFYTELPGDFHGDYPNLIQPFREMLLRTGRPYVIENVRGARRELENWIMLCGHQFGLRVYRHRYFETNPLVLAPPHLRHPEPCPPSGRGKSKKYGFISVTGNGGAPNLGMPYLRYSSAAMGIDWMNRKELSQAIPPAYTEYIGRRILETMRVKL